MADLAAGSDDLGATRTALEAIAKSSLADTQEVRELAAELARDSAGRMIVQLSAAKKKSVGRIVADGVDQALSEDAIAAMIEQVVGLDARSAAAVERYRKMRVENGMPKGQARTLAADYARRLRAARALTIARTEVQRVLGDARRMKWREEFDTGMAAGRVRVVRTRPDCCAICRKERGKRRSIKHIDGGPPFHPNCHCWEENVMVGPVPIPVHPFMLPVAKEEEMIEKASKYPSLERAPGKKDNWVEQAGGLPPYIDKIARTLHYERGMDIGRAIATAKNRCRLWASGGGNVSPDTQAKAAKALAQWEAMKARAKKD